ncbi:MAG TPA: CopG family transcriptional regulator, partial [Candidatus Limnocylindria bacterium]|nr:CopG family transcriptional regulator [Candidatus Limnocylindria bacterium]
SSPTGVSARKWLLLARRWASRPTSAAEPGCHYQGRAKSAKKWPIRPPPNQLMLKNSIIDRREGTGKTEEMYNSYIMKRTQIYLDEEQAIQLNRRAAVRGTTASKLIREAIDEYLAEPDDADARLARFRGAAEETFGIAPYLDEGARYVEKLREADRSRDLDLDERPRR